MIKSHSDKSYLTPITDVAVSTPSDKGATTKFIFLKLGVTHATILLLHELHASSVWMLDSWNDDDDDDLTTDFFSTICLKKNYL